MISRILVPTDVSKTAKKATKYAAELAKQTGATIKLLSVIDTSFYSVQSIPYIALVAPIIEPIEDCLTQAAESYLKDAEKLCRENGIKSKRVIRSGHPVEEIAKEARASKANLIVMGSHGRSAIQAAVLGSVTFGVIHNDSKTPVLVVRR
jgi:nucleotide-binding universal stress UspA family protein